MRSKLVVSFTLLALAASLTGALAGPGRSAGSITGTVTFTGTPPKMRPIDMSKEPSCAAQHATPVMNETIVTGPGNTVQNAVVYISAGDQPSAAPAQAVRYDQKGCEYLPHVLAMHVGQPLEIYNNDQTSHNIHPLARVNPEWNKSQPPGSPAIKASYDHAEFIPVKCNIHPWMHGYFVVLATSHGAVTGNDGKFSLAGLPPGKYTVTAWHEKFGTLSQEVEITGSGAATANFVFKALPY
ncbi:MAG TPA: carboxypeptidase regulatory-like domain-containing protein [Gemmatimonadales bacterium]|jgi:plastocyanin|nr:carboxypeptidase regulatory-like domain-containing protein [Gemmatimonadales bacterium]